MKKQLRQLRGHITRNNNKAEKIEQDAEATPVDISYAEELRKSSTESKEELEEVKEKRRVHAKNTDVGIRHQILGGMDELEIKLNEGNKVGSNLANSDVQYDALKGLESRGKGHFDRKRTGTEQTNGNGMNCLQNFKEVTNALLGMYEQEHSVQQWLKEETVKWEGLAASLFDVQCFFEEP